MTTPGKSVFLDDISEVKTKQGVYAKYDPKFVLHLEAATDVDEKAVDKVYDRVINFWKKEVIETDGDKIRPLEFGRSTIIKREGVPFSLFDDTWDKENIKACYKPERGNLIVVAVITNPTEGSSEGPSIDHENYALNLKRRLKEKYGCKPGKHPDRKASLDKSASVVEKPKPASVIFIRFTLKSKEDKDSADELSTGLKKLELDHGDLYSWGLGRVIDITETSPFEQPGKSVVKINEDSFEPVVGRNETVTEYAAHVHKHGVEIKFGASISEFHTRIQASFGGHVVYDNGYETTFKRTRKETRKFRLKKSADNDFEDEICGWLVKEFKWYDSEEENNKVIVLKKMDEINKNNNDDSFSRKVIPFIEDAGTHYISTVSLGAFERFKETTSTTNIEVGVHANFGHPHIVSAEAGATGRSEATDTHVKHTMRGCVDLVKKEGQTDEEKEYIIDQDAIPVYQLLSSDLNALKRVLHTSIEIYAKRKRGSYFFIKCLGRNVIGEKHNLYLKVNERNELVAVEDLEEASDFEIKQCGTNENIFYIKYRADCLPKDQPRKLDGPLEMLNGVPQYFALKSDNPNVTCTVEEFKKCTIEEKYYINVLDAKTYLQLRCPMQPPMLPVPMVSVLITKEKVKSYYEFKLEQYN